MLYCITQLNQTTTNHEKVGCSELKKSNLNWRGLRRDQAKQNDASSSKIQGRAHFAINQ